MVAELASPNLLTIFLYEHACLIEDSLAVRAKLCITRCELTPILKTFKGDSKDICVELYSVLLPASLGRSISACSHLRPLVGLLITQVQVAVKLIRIHLFAREIPIEVLRSSTLLTRC